MEENWLGMTFRRTAPVRAAPDAQCLALQLTLETGVLKLDPYLAPFADSFKRRYAKAHEWIKRIEETEGGLEKFSRVNAARPLLLHLITS